MKKGKKKNKNYKYMIGIVKYYGDGHIPKTKNVSKTKKAMSLYEARRKGEYISQKNKGILDKPMGDDTVMIFEKKKGKYRPHSQHYEYRGKRYWEKVSDVEDFREGTG